MSNEMKALVKAHARQGLCLQTAPVAEIGPNDVLFRINKTGISETYIHIWNWGEWAVKTVPAPLIRGYEFAGEIVELCHNLEGLVLGNSVAAKGI